MPCLQHLQLPLQVKTTPSYWVTRVCTARTHKDLFIHLIHVQHRRYLFAGSESKNEPRDISLTWKWIYSNNTLHTVLPILQEAWVALPLVRMNYIVLYAEIQSIFYIRKKYILSSRLNYSIYHVCTEHVFFQFTQKPMISSILGKVF